MHTDLSRQSRLTGKVAVVVGGARGIGEGIVRDFVREGASVAIADIDMGNAESILKNLSLDNEKGGIIAIKCDVKNEEDVEGMISRTLEIFGRVDILIYSAGIVKAGSVKTFAVKDFDLVTAVNYRGFFLCVKHVARTMAEQHARNPSLMMDIIQINSKSGLQGSERNFAYSSSKFAGIGLTQSFALELLEDNIKVNAICPGNYFEGPLWSDPKNGLFIQYLKAGKIPGAKTVEDVRRHYESKIPMGRGCVIDDILSAIYYLIEQRYETGQSILVTGGQTMR